MRRLKKSVEEPVQSGVDHQPNSAAFIPQARNSGKSVNVAAQLNR